MKRERRNQMVKKFSQPVTVAVIGAGAVGKEMIRILEERKFPMKELRVLARSDRTLNLNGKKYEVFKATASRFKGVQIALFAGTEGEKGAAVTFGKKAVSYGAIVIDNGSDFRMDPSVPLIIPEINGEDASWHRGIIANPNCTTAVMLMAVAPLHKMFGVKKIVVSTYQALSGAGNKAMESLRSQSEEFLRLGKVQNLGSLSERIAFNLLADHWKIERDGYSNEELKMIKETQKILRDNSIQIIPTAVRVPVFNAHSESIYIELKRTASISEIKKVLAKSPGVLVVDEKSSLNEKFCPMPIEASGRDEILVGRIRKSPFDPKSVLLWVAGDNLRKGAALNAIQIAELFIDRPSF